MSYEHSVSPPPVPATQSTGGVRRHHTISAASRAARAQSRISEADETEQQAWHDDEVVDQEWMGGMGAVGEKGSSLHRQSSLPSRYNKAFQRGGSLSRQAGNLTPRTMNSLTAITAEHGHENEEEEWENEMKDWHAEEDRPPSEPTQQVSESHPQSGSSSQSPLSPHFTPPTQLVPSPPPASANVRRHQSLTYGTGGQRRSALKRSGTLQAQIERPSTNTQTPSPPNNEEEVVEEESPTDENYAYPIQQPVPTHQGQFSPGILGRNAWTPQTAEWRPNSGTSGTTIDDVQRALANVEISQSHLVHNPEYQSQSNVGNAQAPRFGHFNPQSVLSGKHRMEGSIDLSRNDKLHLVTSIERAKPQGPVSASATVPPIGHGSQHQRHSSREDRTHTASGSWDQKDRALHSRTSNPNIRFNNSGFGGSVNIPPNPPIPSQYLNQQGQAPRLGVMTSFGQVGQNQQQGSLGMASSQPAPSFITSPIDVPTLIATKGYNPADFDIRPSFARYFVIKSYTEDDVHKSLKYEIWSSTDPGNKRLDKAFKETAGRGPIYLFFSVNASGHFCGMAEMLTPVDYTRSSTVWASDKWKGVFKVRWIFVRDIPNANLRHIKLNNTQERKPVTNSRDTQELLPDAGQEMLRIFFTHPARTSLLQDFAFYELQAMQKLQQHGGSDNPNLPSSSAQGGIPSQPQQHPYAMANPSALSYANQLQMPALSQMMQMQMNSQYSHPHTIQSVLRDPSPIPVNQGGNYLSMSGGF